MIVNTPASFSALTGVEVSVETEVAINFRSSIDNVNLKKAVVVGAGFIGLEMALHLMGFDLSLVDIAPQILPNLFDFKISLWAENALNTTGIKIITSTSLLSIKRDDGF